MSKTRHVQHQGISAYSKLAMVNTGYTIGESYHKSKREIIEDAKDYISRANRERAKDRKMRILKPLY